MKVFKIRNKLTGQFSSGGLYPCWENNGRVYTSKPAALTIVHRVLNRNGCWRDGFIKNGECIAELVEYGYVEVAVTPIIDPKK